MIGFITCHWPPFKLNNVSAKGGQVTNPLAYICEMTQICVVKVCIVKSLIVFMNSRLIS